MMSQARATRETRSRVRDLRCPRARAADIVRYRTLLTVDLRFIPARFPPEVMSPEPRLLRVNSILRIRADRPPDLAVVREPLSRGVPRRVRSTRSGPG